MAIGKGKLKILKRDMARQRIEILFKHVLETAYYNMELAEKEAILIKRISMKYRVRLPYEIRQLFCKKCKRLIIPGRTSRVRVGHSSIKAVRIRCLYCNHLYHKILNAER